MFYLCVLLARLLVNAIVFFVASAHTTTITKTQSIDYSRFRDQSRAAPQNKCLKKCMKVTKNINTQLQVMSRRINMMWAERCIANEKT